MHTVIPVARTHERQTMNTLTQSVTQGAHTMFVERGALRAKHQKVVVRVFFRIQCATPQKRCKLFPHGGVTRSQYIATGGLGQPEVVVRAACAYAPALRRMPPVLHIALTELARCTTQQMFAQQTRCRMDQGHAIL